MGIKVKTNIELGWRVKDSITGFEGIATGYAKFLNGCERIAITPETLHEGKVLDIEYFDVHQLVVLNKKPQMRGKPKKGGKEGPGGPFPAPKQAANPR